MNNPFYPFILNMWIMEYYDEEDVRFFVPKLISEKEAEMILLTPQNPESLLFSV